MKYTLLSMLTVLWAIGLFSGHTLAALVYQVVVLGLIVLTYRLPRRTQAVRVRRF
jgi:uncharacterized membrane protein YciS (DUF1049 family)